MLCYFCSINGQVTPSKNSGPIYQTNSENTKFDQIKDPKTNKVPQEIQEAALSFSKPTPAGAHSKQGLESSRASKSSNYYYWKNIGPYNVGGNTNLIAIDRSNEDVIFAGGAFTAIANTRSHSGLWRSPDGGKSWKNVLAKKSSLNVSCITQDPRPGKEHIWYYGTGKRVYSSRYIDHNLGKGIFKSYDGGKTWAPLASTFIKNFLEVSTFSIIHNITINPINGDIYVAAYDGIYRSKNNGTSFEPVFASDKDTVTNIEVTSSGQFYAAIANGTFKGYYTSSTGDKNSWVDITPAKVKEQRIYRAVIEIDPSNENIVYFLSGAEHYHEVNLFRFNAKAENPENSWADLSTNIPDNNYRSGFSSHNQVPLSSGPKFSTHLTIEVSPLDSNLIVIGLENLFRSTTGFTTPPETVQRIGGSTIKKGLVRGDSYDIPNHGRGQGAVAFFPSNPKKLISGHYSGISITQDITANISKEEPVQWNYLNNGYVTTSVVDIAFDPTGQSDEILASFENAGDWSINTSNNNNIWKKRWGGIVDVTKGDAAIANNGKTQYVCEHNGGITRLDLDEQGEVKKYTNIHQPTFTYQFSLDPIDDNIMYSTSGNNLYINDNMDDNGTDINFFVPITYVPYSNTDQYTDQEYISSHSVSYYPVARKVYFGTSEGRVYRVDNVNNRIHKTELIDIFTNKGLPKRGHVRDVNVDPSNDKRVIISFSDFNITSLFLTEDSGETWTNISGNLEENPDGSGNGPSVMETAFFGGSKGYYGAYQKILAATSTGLYYTFRLNGENTHWYKENYRIGNTPIRKIKVRNDGFVVAGTESHGVLCAKFPVFNKIPERMLSIRQTIENMIVDKRQQRKIDLKDVFVHAKGAPITFRLENSNPEIVTASIDGNFLILDFDPEKIAKLEIIVTAIAGEEEIGTGFTIDAVDPTVIYETIGQYAGNFPSLHFNNANVTVQCADDFMIPEGDTWSIDRMFIDGIRYRENLDNLIKITEATVIIYNDDQGKPGKEIYNSGRVATKGEFNVNYTRPALLTHFNFQFPEKVVLGSGKYWVSFYPIINSTAVTEEFWYWYARGETLIGSPMHIKDPSAIYKPGITEWTPTEEPKDLDFKLFGVVNAAATPNQKSSLLGQYVSVSPNPSSDRFTFKFDQKLDVDHIAKKVTLKIYDILGKEVFSDIKETKSSEVTWDASKMNTGLYIVKILNGTNKQILKIFKK